MEIIIELIAEIIIQLFGEAIAEFFSRLLSPVFGGRPMKIWLWPALGYIALGIALGFISLELKGEHFIRNPVFRHANLIVTPLLVGWIMKLRGRALEKRGKRTVRIDSFLFGYLFAFAFGLTRYLFAV